jgi:hypothetical protein
VRATVRAVHARATLGTAAAASSATWTSQSSSESARCPAAPSQRVRRASSTSSVTSCATGSSRVPALFSTAPDLVLFLGESDRVWLTVRRWARPRAAGASRETRASGAAARGMTSLRARPDRGSPPARPLAARRPRSGGCTRASVGAARAGCGARLRLTLRGHGFCTRSRQVPTGPAFAHGIEEALTNGQLEKRSRLDSIDAEQPSNIPIGD